MTKNKKLQHWICPKNFDCLLFPVFSLLFFPLDIFGSTLDTMPKYSIRKNNSENKNNKAPTKPQLLAVQKLSCSLRGLEVSLIFYLTPAMTYQPLLTNLPVFLFFVSRILHQTLHIQNPAWGF